MLCKMSLTYRIETDYDSDDSDYQTPINIIHIIYEDRITVEASLENHSDVIMWDRIILHIRNDTQCEFGGNGPNGNWASVWVTKSKTVIISVRAANDEDILLRFIVPSEMFLPIAEKIRDELSNVRRGEKD